MIYISFSTYVCNTYGLSLFFFFLSSNVWPRLVKRKKVWLIKWCLWILYMRKQLQWVEQISRGKAQIHKLKLKHNNVVSSLFSFISTSISHLLFLHHKPFLLPFLLAKTPRIHQNHSFQRRWWQRETVGYCFSKHTFSSYASIL